MLRRVESARARTDTRTWIIDRRARTRRLIELGGLVAKSGLEEIVADHDPDTAAAVLGALLHLAAELRAADTTGPSQSVRVKAWRDRGREALRQEQSSRR